MIITNLQQLLLHKEKKNILTIRLSNELKCFETKLFVNFSMKRVNEEKNRGNLS